MVLMIRRWPRCGGTDTASFPKGGDDGRGVGAGGQPTFEAGEVREQRPDRLGRRGDLPAHDNAIATSSTRPSARACPPASPAATATSRSPASSFATAIGAPTPWPGDPRVNIQSDKGKAKAYQVRQVLRAIAKLDEGQ